MNPWRDAPVLSGRHVTLRPLRADDAGPLREVAVDSDLSRLFYTTASGLADDPDAFVAGALAGDADGRSLSFAVETPDGRVVGMTRFLRMNEAHRRVEVGGTFYARSVRRTGVNTEAKLLLLTHAFEVLGCQVVQIRTDWFNKASQAAIERLGAKRDGVLRSHQMLDERVRDLVVYSIVAGEWPGVRTNLNWLLEKPR